MPSPNTHAINDFTVAIDAVTGSLEINPLHLLYYSIPAKTLIPKDQKLVALPDDITVHDAIDRLNSKNILSAPVYNTDGICCGYISLKTILNFVSTWNRKQSLNTILEFPISTVLKNLKEKQEGFLPFFSENPLSILTNVLSRIRRVALFHVNKEFIGTISQSDVVSHLCTVLHNPTQFRHVVPEYMEILRDTPIEKLQIMTPATTITKDTSILDGILQLPESSLSLAIVDQDKTIVADFTLRYFSQFSISDLELLRTPCIDWLQDHAIKGLSPVYIHASMTFGEVCKLICDKKLHQLWVVDDNKHLTHIITLGSILKLFSGDQVNERIISGDTDISKLWFIDYVNTVHTC